MYYTSLKSYAYNNKEPKKISVEEYIKKIEIVSDTCYLEVLVCNTIKVFFDVDSLKSETDFERVLKQIKSAFEEKFKVKVNKIAITKNTKKYSYHIYFPEYRTTKEKLKKFIEPLRENIPEIDRIYTKNRLLRSVNQPKPMPGGIVDKTDRHLLIKGTIQDTIIQDTKGTTLL